MRFLRPILASAAALLLTSLAVPATAASVAVETDLHARLTGSSSFPGATGSSEYDRGAGGRDVKVTVTRIGRLAGQRVTVIINGTRVGTMLVSSTGRAHREWDSEHGQAVPLARAGSPVRVRTSGGTLVASGRYVLERHN